jgi:hypothetical protein|tara:strand:+ start:463 stop:642 length:180 start_codon:yes stop_codon:yes gene_type:complete
MSYYVELEEDQNGDLVIPLPEEVIETLGWQMSDLLTWDLKGDGIVLQRLNGDGGYETLE